MKSIPMTYVICTIGRGPSGPEILEMSLNFTNDVPGGE